MMMFFLHSRLPQSAPLRPMGGVVLLRPLPNMKGYEYGNVER